MTERIRSTSDEQEPSSLHYSHFNWPRCTELEQFFLSIQLSLSLLELVGSQDTKIGKK